MYSRMSFLKMTAAQYRMCATALTCCAFLFVFGVTGAVGSETRQHGSHLHGVGQLNIALDGNKLFFELESPAANIVGFEHAPENEKQSHEVHEAVELLEKGETLFVLTPEAKCSLLEAHVESDLLGEDHDGQEPQQGEHEAEHHEHKEAHSEKAHAEHSAHSDFEASYLFECASPDSLKNIDVKLFSHFPGFEELEVQMLTPKSQTAAELTPKSFQISL